MRAEAPKGGNLASLAVIQGFRMVAGFAVNTMVMRALGVEGFGIYGYVVILANLAGFSSTMGMDRLLKREMARAPEDSDRWVLSGLAASALLATGTVALIAALALLLDGRPDVVVAACLAAVALGLQSVAAVPVARFHAMRRMALGVRPSAAGKLALVAATAWVVWRGGGVVAVFSAQVLDGAVVALLAWSVWRRQRGRGAQMVPWSRTRELLRESVPFGLNGLFGTIYLSADVLLLAWMRDDREVGVYRAAVMLISLFPVIAETLTSGIYPRMARHLGSPKDAGKELAFASRILLAISVPAAVGGILLAEPLMVLLGGAQFTVSALPFQIMAPLLPLRFLNNGYAMTLSALDRQSDRTRGVFYAALFNIAANLLVIPRFGAVGTAATTLVTEVLLAVWLRWRVGPLVERLSAGSAALRVGVPAAVMGLVLATLPSLPVLVAIGVGAAVYGVTGSLTGAWSWADLPRLRSV